jgi:arylformamidase
MTGLDYEAEYNNRARVPEHPEIFARWHRDAKAYRDHSPGARLGLRYGAGERQTIDVFPGHGEGSASPVMMFIHGGWWRSLHPDEFSHLAAGPNAHGVTVAMVGYELCPAVTIVDIVDQMRAAALFLWREWGRPFAVAGHSAGGHLCACLLATEWQSFDPQAPDGLVPAAYAISGVFDLAPLTGTSINTDLRLDERSARDLSPIHWPVPSGRVLDAVVGGIESSEFLRQSQAIAAAWRPRAETRYEAIAGKNHFDVIDALADPDSTMTRRVVELARQVQTVER